MTHSHCVSNPALSQNFLCLVKGHLNSASIASNSRPPCQQPCRWLPATFSICFIGKYTWVVAAPPVVEAITLFGIPLAYFYNDQLDLVSVVRSASKHLQIIAGCFLIRTVWKCVLTVWKCVLLLSNMPLGTRSVESIEFSPPLRLRLSASTSWRSEG